MAARATLIRFGTIAASRGFQIMMDDSSVTLHGSRIAAERLPIRGPIGIRDFGARGRGIVALADIPAGQLIERSPVLVIPSADRPAVDATIVFTYVFMWEKGTTEEDLYQHQGRAAIALGHTSLLSHSYQPNCSFVRHIDELMIDVLSTRAIKAGEELTIDYQMTLWFDPQPI